MSILTCFRSSTATTQMQLSCGRSTGPPGPVECSLLLCGNTMVPRKRPTTMVDGPLPGTTGYWKTRVSEVTRPLLERALRRSGCFYEFDAGTGMLFYSNLRSVALGMPPACGSLALHRPELLPGIFRLLVRESLDYHQVLKYVAKREAKQWPVWVNDKTFRYFATNQVSGVHQGDDNVVMVNPELDNTGAEEGVNGLL